MRLEKVSGEGPDALYDLYYKGQKVAGLVTIEELKAAIDHLEAQEVKHHD